MNEKNELLTQDISGMELINQGSALQKTQTEFTTAISIQRPRERVKVVVACQEEAAIAGDEFYYSWLVKTKTGKKQLVEGLSIQAALAAARNWGNCAIPCSVEEKEGSYIFTASFLDFETGFNLQRTYRQRKSQNVGEGMRKDSERLEDLTFQIGQSKALRNVILNALPSWLSSKMLVKAKENVSEKIKKMGIAQAREKTIEFFLKHDIDTARVEAKVSKKASYWNIEDLTILQGAMNTLLSGQETADSLFPPLSDDSMAGTATKTDNLKKRLKKEKDSGSIKTKSEFVLKMARFERAIGIAKFREELGGLGFEDIIDIEDPKEQAKTIDHFETIITAEKDKE